MCSEDSHADAHIFFSLSQRRLLLQYKIKKELEPIHREPLTFPRLF